MVFEKKYKEIVNKVAFLKKFFQNKTPCKKALFSLWIYYGNIDITGFSFNIANTTSGSFRTLILPVSALQ